jgi:hypothetical protein
MDENGFFAVEDGTKAVAFSLASDRQSVESLIAAANRAEAAHERADMHYRANVKIMNENAALRKRIETLEEVIDDLLTLYHHANEGAFSNDVKAEDGTDEGDVIASRYIARAIETLAAPKEVQS